MKRIRKVLVIAVLGVLVFLFLPVLPIRADSPDLYAQHGWCYGGSIAPGSPPTSVILASASYVSFHSGVVYVREGGYLWWLPTPDVPSGSECN